MKNAHEIITARLRIIFEAADTITIDGMVARASTSDNHFGNGLPAMWLYKHQFDGQPSKIIALDMEQIVQLCDGAGEIKDGMNNKRELVVCRSRRLTKEDLLEIDETLGLASSASDTQEPA